MRKGFGDREAFETAEVHNSRCLIRGNLFYIEKGYWGYILRESMVRVLTENIK